MENLISKQFLVETTRNKSTEVTTRFSLAKQNRSRGKYSFETSIFLSHKHGEIEVLEQVIYLLSKVGINIYVDWLDHEMPKITNGDTAKRIKEKIKKCDKFIFLATEQAIASKWCNWELGFGDAHKYSDKIAVMPIKETNSGSFSGNEYLSIYPIITTQYYYVEGNLYVEFEGRKILLQDWIATK